MLTRNTIPHSGKIYWNKNIGDGYNFKANERYKIHYASDKGVFIFAPDEIRLDNGEVTEDILKLANYEE